MQGESRIPHPDILVEVSPLERLYNAIFNFIHERCDGTREELTRSLEQYRFSNTDGILTGFQDALLTFAEAVLADNNEDDLFKLLDDVERSLQE